MRNCLLVLFALLTTHVWAQELYDHTPNARIAAMGGASVATSADAFAAFGNAASAAMEYKTVQVAFAYQKKRMLLPHATLVLPSLDNLVEVTE